MKALLIDYGSGNLRSAAKALEAAGFSVAVAQDPKAHEEADLLVLPGQGHFGQVMRAFQESGFVERVRRHLERGLPFLGICVGMQVLYEGSEEAPGVRGLGLVPGEVRVRGHPLHCPPRQGNPPRAPVPPREEREGGSGLPRPSPPLL